MSATDVASEIVRSSSEALQEKLGLLHDVLFGGDGSLSPVAMKNSITKHMEEFKIPRLKKGHSKTRNFTAEFLPEVCLLMGDILISVSNEVPCKPSVPSYLRELEDALLPKVFLRTKVSPQQLLRILLHNPLQIFMKEASVLDFSDRHTLKYFEDIEKAFQSLQMNFGMDLLPFLKKSGVCAEDKNALTTVQKRSAATDGKEKRTKNSSSPLQHSLPAYLLTKKHVSAVDNAGSSFCLKEVSQCKINTPENSDDDILAFETPVKKRKLL